MRHRQVAACGVALALLAGCATGTAERPTANGPLYLSPNGFLAGQTGLEIGFGRAPEGAVAAISDLTGTHPVATDEACGEPGARVARYPGGLAVTFRERMFAGWDVAGREGAFATREGLTTGIAADLIVDGAYRVAASETFSASGITGRIGPDGTITRLWAGAPCPAP